MTAPFSSVSAVQHDIKMLMVNAEATIKSESFQFHNSRTELEVKAIENKLQSIYQKAVSDAEQVTKNFPKHIIEVISAHKERIEKLISDRCKCALNAVEQVWQKKEQVQSPSTSPTTTATALPIISAIDLNEAEITPSTHESETMSIIKEESSKSDISLDKDMNILEVDASLKTKNDQELKSPTSEKNVSVSESFSNRSPQLSKEPIAIALPNISSADINESTIIPSTYESTTLSSTKDESATSENSLDKNISTLNAVVAEITKEVETTSKAQAEQQVTSSDSEKNSDSDKGEDTSNLSPKLPKENP